MKVLPHVTAARFTQIDYDREMALVLADEGVPGKADVHGVARLVADPDHRAAEFAIIVEQKLTGIGLGKWLMRRLVDYARSRGMHELFGDVLADNTAMRSLARSLGFVESRAAGDDFVVRVTLALDRYVPH
jgi:acetyltransferase